jgi:hypothetical protein
MWKVVSFVAVAGLLAGCAGQYPPTAIVPTGDTVVLLASDTTFGPSMADADVAARYYCSSRGKMADFLSRERPPEMRGEVFAEYSVLTFRCVVPQTAGP